MKSLILIALALISINTSFASDIRGLNSEQIKDLNLCLKKRNLTFNEINGWENQVNRGDRVDTSKPLFHNFNERAGESDEVNGQEVDNGIFVSGLYYIDGQHSFKNAIISNMTFVGDFSQLNFEGACLVNVRFHQAGFFDLMKIRHQADATKNIESI
jgi:hypothetical protein